MAIGSAGVGLASNDWNRALDAAESAERELKVAMCSNLFAIDPASFERLIQCACDARKLAEQDLELAVAAYHVQL